MVLAAMTTDRAGWPIVGARVCLKPTVRVLGWDRLYHKSVLVGALLQDRACLDSATRPAAGATANRGPTSKARASPTRTDADLGGDGEKQYTVITADET